MNQQIEKNEPVKVLPTLDTTKFNHWEDYLYNLQLGHTKLPNIGNEKSNEIGGYGFSICRQLILNLREKQLDQNEEPLIICTDEVSDEQVVVETNPVEVQEKFLDAFISEAKKYWLEGMPGRADSYVTAALALGRGVTGLSVNEMQKRFENKVSEDTTLSESKRQLLSKALENTSDQVGILTDYLKFSESQMTNEEQRILLTAKKESPQIGDEPLEINGENYTFENSNIAPVEIDSEDIEAILPLQKAVRRGRKEMAEQATELAYQRFGLDRDKNDDLWPPEWWMDGENGEALKSNEILMYIPNEVKTSADILPMVRTLLEKPNFNFGWNKLTFSKENPNLVVGVTSLSN